jgi:hypothetical protein
MWNQAFFSLPSKAKFSLQFQISLPKRKWGRTLLLLLDVPAAAGNPPVLLLPFLLLLQY